MKIKLSELLAKKEAMEHLVGTKTTAAVGFRLAKNIRAINAEYAIYTEANNALIKKFGTEQEDGNFKVEPNTEGIILYVDELKPLLDEEVEIDIQQVKLSELGDKFELEPMYMEAMLDFVITE